MRRRQFSALLATTLLASCALPRQEAASLQGTWAPQSAQLSGAPFAITSFGGANLHLTGDGYEFAGDKGSYSLVGNLGPIAAMDILGREGPNAGKRIPAIYALEGDQLTICYQLGKGERPTEFVSPKGKLVLLIVYKRAPA